MLKNSEIKKRIIKLLENSIDNDESVDINHHFIEIMDKVKIFIDKMEKNTDDILTILNEYCSHKENIVDISYDKYLSLNIPLYLIHLIKKIYEGNIQLPDNICINNYENLQKENIYREARKANQMILMWKNLGEGYYCILSMCGGYDELDPLQNIFFTSIIGGKAVNQVVCSWDIFNRFTKAELVHNTAFKDLRTAIIDLFTCTHEE